MRSVYKGMPLEHKTDIANQYVVLQAFVCEETYKGFYLKRFIIGQQLSNEIVNKMKGNRLFDLKTRCICTAETVISNVR